MDVETSKIWLGRGHISRISLLEFATTSSGKKFYYSTLTASMEIVWITATEQVSRVPTGSHPDVKYSNETFDRVTHLWRLPHAKVRGQRAQEVGETVSAHHPSISGQ